MPSRSCDKGLQHSQTIPRFLLTSHVSQSLLQVIERLQSSFHKLNAELQKTKDIELQWYEKFQAHKEAVEGYEQRNAHTPSYGTSTSDSVPEQRRLSFSSSSGFVRWRWLRCMLSRHSC